MSVLVDFPYGHGSFQINFGHWSRIQLTRGPVVPKPTVSWFQQGTSVPFAGFVSGVVILIVLKKRSES